MLPAWSERLLPTGQAAYSRNGYLFSGNLTGWRKPKVLRDLVNSAARMVYRIPTISETQALAYLVFKLNPSAGDTVAIGDLTYTWVTVLTNPQDVLIGADTAASAVNLVAAITADNGQNTNMGVLYGDNTVANGEVKFYPPNSDPQTGLAAPSTGVAAIGGPSFSYLVVGALDFGAAYNLVLVNESTAGVRTIWLADLSAFVDTTTTFAGGSNPSFDNRITGDAIWLEFLDPDTNVVKSPVVDDQWKRYYFASPSRMPEYNTYDRIRSGAHPWLLGVPPPGCAVTLAVAGGGNNLVLGNNTDGGDKFDGNSNWVYLIKVTPTGDTQIQDIQWNISETFGDPNGYPAANFAGLLYDDNAGTPGTLMNTGQIIKGVNFGAPNVSSFVNPTNLSNNTPYWIGFMIDTAVPIETGPAGGNNNVASFPNTFTNGPPGIAPSGGGIALGQPGLNLFADFITSDIIESRAYVYTWVSEYGEEGPPSPPTLLDGWSNGVWTLGLWSPPPDDLGILRNLKKLNIYRTVPGQGGATVFFFVVSLDIGTATYTDNTPNNIVALNDQLKSTTWFPPPANLQGFIVLPNGVVAGFVNNEIWFCEPYRLHAWPPGYVLTVDFPVVGLGVTNGALIVCTAAAPYVISGINPGQMTQSKCSDANPCSSRASILGGDAAVSYMSPNGLIQVTAAGAATNTTDLWFTRENWQQLTPPQYARAIYLASCYYCLGSVSPTTVSPVDTAQAQRGFTIELDQDNTSFTIWPQPGGHRLGFNLLDTPTGSDVQNVQTDPWTGTGLVISDAKVWYFDFSDAAPEMIPYVWRSKLYQQNVKRSYEAMKVFFTVPSNTPTQNPTRIEEVASDTVWDTLPADSYGFIKTFVDVDGTGNLTLIDVREIRKSGELLRIVDGFKADTWQWQIEGRVLISNVQIATSAKELANV